MSWLLYGSGALWCFLCRLLVIVRSFLCSRSCSDLAIADRREGFATRRRSSGGAGTTSFNDYDLGWPFAGKRWSALSGLSLCHQHSTSDFIFGQADLILPRIDGHL